MYQHVHDAGKIALSHCCGSVAEILPDLIEIGLDVLESVQPEAVDMNPYELKRRFGSEITFWGGLGSQSTIQYGTPEEVAAEILKLSKEMGIEGGYILAPSKALQPGTPVRNAAAVVEAFLRQSKITFNNTSLINPNHGKSQPAFLFGGVVSSQKKRGGGFASVRSTLANPPSSPNN